MPKNKPIKFSSVALLLVLLPVLVGVRASLVDRKIGVYLGCPNCFDMTVLHADLLMFYVVTGALLLAGVLRSRLSGRVLHLGIGLVLLYYIADLLVFRLFSYRLFYSDVLLYFTEWPTVWDQFSSGVGGFWTALLITLLLIGLFLFLFFLPVARGKPVRFLLLSTLLISLTADFMLDSPPFVNSWATDNVFRVNMGTAERARYTPEFKAGLGESDSLGHYQGSGPGPQKGRNVILVVLESWSSWHSAEFGGFHDWTPRLDEAARRGRRFTNFHSIGFATVNGLVGIFGGQDVWSPFLPLFERTPFHSMWAIDRTLPRTFTAAGYSTAFLTTGPLTLYRKGEWMTDIGFAHVEGGEHPSYSNEKKFAFKSPSDAALYRRSMEWIKSANEPYFLALETVSTHQPYVDPDSGERSLEKAMRFADSAFAEFLEKLDAASFFDQGILVVASDHRSMTPISERELETFGPTASSQVPAFVIGEEFIAGSVDERVLSQGDFVPTFEWWLSGSVELESLDTIMFDDTRSVKCAFHERGDRRGILSAICPEGNGQIYLDGDNTRFLESTGLSEERMKSILVTVARERLSDLQRHQRTQGNSSSAAAQVN